jgi:hypothetical protein
MLTAEQAVYCMLADPLLIRRPLMEVGDKKIVGFEPRQVEALLNVGVNKNKNLESCPKDHTQSPCEAKQ